MRLAPRMIVAVAGGALALAACSTGTNAVDQTAGSQSGYVQTGSTSRVFAPGQRQAAPAVTGPLVGGGSFDLAAQRGHVVVLNLWGSWCPDCRLEARDLESVYQAHRADGVVFVGVDIRDDAGGAQAFMRAKGITYPSIDDPSSRVALGFRGVPPSSIPSTIVIDAQGRTAALHLGVVSAAELTRLITEASS